MIDLGELAEHGVLTTPLLDSTQLASLQAVLDELDLDERQPFLASSNDLDRPQARRVDQRLKEILAPALAEVLPDHRPFLASYLVKGAHDGARIDFHQDLSYTDERTARTVVVWIPLCDTDEQNGALQVVPGSHRWSAGSRPGGCDALPTAPLQGRIGTIARSVPVPAGTAVVYDAALLHGSPPNLGDRVRAAVGVALVPADAELVHVHADEDGTGATAYRVDDEYHVAQGLRTRPVGYPEVPLWSPPVTTAELAAHLPAPTGSVLLDPELDAALRDDGFVVAPFPAALELAAALREAYGELHGWQGQGFEADLTNADNDYRRQVSELLSAALDESVGALFVDVDPFLRVFLCKWPGEGSDLYLHRDWMYVDEREGHSTYVAWIPLQDVDLDNGPLQVLRGSHLLDESLRGTHLNAPWIQLGEVIRPRLETVTARLGEVVILNNALVHSSLPNQGSEPRLIAAVGVRPAGVPLVHFLQLDADQAARFDVDEDFFLTVTPQALMAQAPDLEVRERLPGAQREPDAEQLATWLDGGPPPPPPSVGTTATSVHDVTTEAHHDVGDTLVATRPEAPATATSVPDIPSSRPSTRFVSRLRRLVDARRR